MPPQGHGCGWTEYPFWRCANGREYDLRIDPDEQMRGRPLPPFCPGCGARLRYAGPPPT